MSKSKVTMATYVPWPLDTRLLELMPDQGLIGGVHHAGRTVRGMVKQINDDAQQVVVTSAQAQSRARILRELGLAEHYPASGGRVWARTAEGKRYLAKSQLEAEPTPPEDDGSSAAAPVVELPQQDQQEESGPTGPVATSDIKEAEHGR